MRLKFNTFYFNTTSGLRFGCGMSRSSCPEIFAKLGSRILFVTDEGLMSLRLTKPTLEELQKLGRTEILDKRREKVLNSGKSSMSTFPYINKSFLYINKLSIIDSIKKIFKKDLSNYSLNRKKLFLVVIGFAVIGILFSIIIK